MGRDGELGSKPAFFSMTCEGDANIQQEHVGVKMLIFFLLHGEHRIFNEYLVIRGKKNANKCIRNSSDKQPRAVAVCAVSGRGVLHLFLCLFFLRTILFCHVAEDLCSHKPSVRLPEINPLWKPGNAAGKLSPCSGALRSLNPWASWGQSSLMKSQYLDGTVPRICKHAA